MAPLLTALLPSLITGAKEILTDKQARKENLKKPSTLTGASLVASAALSAISPETASTAAQSVGLPPDSLEGALTQLALAIVGVVLVFLRRGRVS